MQKNTILSYLAHASIGCVACWVQYWKQTFGQIQRKCWNRCCWCGLPATRCVKQPNIERRHSALATVCIPTLEASFYAGQKTGRPPNVFQHQRWTLGTCHQPRVQWLHDASHHTSVQHWKHSAHRVAAPLSVLHLRFLELVPYFATRSAPFARILEYYAYFLSNFTFCIAVNSKKKFVLMGYSVFFAPRPKKISTEESSSRKPHHYTTG